MLLCVWTLFLTFAPESHYTDGTCPEILARWGKSFEDIVLSKQNLEFKKIHISSVLKKTVSTWSLTNHEINKTSAHCRVFFRNILGQRVHVIKWMLSIFLVIFIINNILLMKNNVESYDGYCSWKDKCCVTEFSVIYHTLLSFTIVRDTSHILLEKISWNGLSIEY